LYVRKIIKVRCVLLCAAIGPSEEHVIDEIYCWLYEYKQMQLSIIFLE